MKPVAINLLSAVAGAFLLSLVFVSTGALAPPGPQRVLVENAVQVQGQWRPTKAVRVYEGAPYTVPAGMILVFTAIGQSSNDFVETQGYIDGIIVVARDSGGVPSLAAIPPGLTAQAGQVVSVSGGSTPTAWGYLVDAVFGG